MSVERFGLSEEFPLSVDQLRGLLPHRKPMVWVDRILSATSQYGLTEVTLNRNLMLAGSRIHVGAIIEFLAQSYGYIMAVEAKQRRQRLQTVQLAAIDKFELLSEPLPAVGETLTAELVTVRDIHPLYLVKGRVFAPAKRELCVMEFKGYAQFGPE